MCYNFCFNCLKVLSGLPLFKIHYVFVFTKPTTLNSLIDSSMNSDGKMRFG